MITIVDSATIFPLNTIQNKINGIPFDFYDFIAEFISFYMPLKSPPDNLVEYGKPWGDYDFFNSQECVSSVTNKLSLIEDMSMAVSFGMDMLSKIQTRKYSCLVEFKEDFNSYLEIWLKELQELPSREKLIDIWSQALRLLSDGYWSKYLFDYKVDLVHYT